MALSDAVKQKAVRRARRRSVTAKDKHWSDSQKLEAVTLWLALGNVPMVAATLRIPVDTIRLWRKSEWWAQCAEEIKLQEKIQLSKSATDIVNKAMFVIGDRLENGDWIYDQKTGEMKRKPVVLRDAVHAANVMLDKKLLLDKQEMSTASEERIEEKLDKLKDMFSKLAGATADKPMEVTDVIFVDKETEDAVYEGREEGLCEGEQAVQQSPGTNQETQ